uniref:cell number regulator 10-like n=1 Tax=Erigeron canadensis TaxID=72917 RepID=UPI001CB990A3|nr:cell number regulator 10-like [Erigeron canadensis]
MYASNEPRPQYTTGVPVQHMTTPGKRSTGLCDCSKDWSSCCLTCWCPCISFGRIAEVVDMGTTSCGVSGALYSVLCLFTGCECIYSFMYRSKVRKQCMLPEQPCNDCLLHCCCNLCALCQEYRELKYRGIEPAFGWQGNLANQTQGVVMAPIGPGEIRGSTKKKF